MVTKINTIDLFAGCGGLMEGFEHEKSYSTLACVEWEKTPCTNLVHRLNTKWGHSNAKQEVIQFDIQRTEELFNGFDDTEYGFHHGLDSLVDGQKVHIIVGGPPCQAYSLAGRIRDKNGMRDDYRNYLFESYLKVVNKYRPHFFVFENVQGMLSATPEGTPITDRIKQSFEDSRYIVLDDFKNTMFNLSEFGIPQNRKRILILGVNSDIYGDKSKELLSEFYDSIMQSYKKTKTTVKESIGDLPKLFPAEEFYKIDGKKLSHIFSSSNPIKNHIPRYHSRRDMDIFHLLAKDIEEKTNKYIDAEQLKKLYKDVTGKDSSVHKYYVLRNDYQSNTIPAHLHKDGLRHIHPDSSQMRSITVREAARLQTFDDDYEFIGGMMQQYKMIGNAVPPKFSLIIAKAIKQLINKYGLGE